MSGPYPEAFVHGNGKIDCEMPFEFEMFVGPNSPREWVCPECGTVWELKVDYYYEPRDP